jgi:hypothetical protein
MVISLFDIMNRGNDLNDENYDAIENKILWEHTITKAEFTKDKILSDVRAMILLALIEAAHKDYMLNSLSEYRKTLK